MGKLYGASIYKVLQCNIYPYAFNTVHNVAVYTDEMKKWLSEGFYFSYGYDLTSSRQRRIQFLSQKPPNKDPLKAIACDHKYFWNLQLYTDLIE